MVSVHTVTERKTARHVWQDFKYAFYLIVHPFKGFWEIKHENKGNVKMATVFLLLYLVLSVLSGFYTGYLFNSGSALDFNPVKEIFMVLLLFFGFCIANWCLTCLFDGEGNFKDIYKATGYALIPMIIAQLVLLPLSNYLVMEESVFYTGIHTFGMIWMLFLIVIGTLVTHQYSIGKTLVIMVSIVFGMCILAYIGLLFFNLIQQMVGFIMTLVQEFSLRNM